MTIEYKSKKLKKSLLIEKELIKKYGNRAKKIKQRMRELSVADNLSIIAKLPALRLHLLKGNKQEYWAIDIMKNWRICFLIYNDPVPLLEDGGIDLKEVTIIKIISIEDYH